MHGSIGASFIVATSNLVIIVVISNFVIVALDYAKVFATSCNYTSASYSLETT
jgi:hypothetical protein